MQLCPSCWTGPRIHPWAEGLLLKTPDEELGLLCSWKGPRPAARWVWEPGAHWNCSLAQQDEASMDPIPPKVD